MWAILAATGGIWSYVLIWALVNTFGKGGRRDRGAKRQNAG